jgi:Holliday junction resolvase RusA-like endonuclease
MKINVKPLSINQAYRTQKKTTRYKTAEYIAYENNMMFLLPKADLSKYDKIQLTLDIYVSTKSFDLDNALKPCIDLLQKKRDFNDNKVYRIIATKHIVSK